MAIEEIPKSKIRRSDMMTKYEHMMSDMFDAQNRQEFVLKQYMFNRRWFHCFTDWLLKRKYEVVPNQDGYNVIRKNEPKRKHSDEQMSSIGDLFESYEDVDRERGTTDHQTM